MLLLSGWTRTNKISLATLAITFLALMVTAFIAWIAQKKLLPQEATKMQLELVSKLVNTLAATQIPVNLSWPDGGKYLSANVFSFSILKLAKELNNKPCFISWPQNWNECFAFLNNPLLPSSISESLSNLRSLGKFTEIKTLDISNGHSAIGLLFNPNTISAKVISGGMPEFLRVCEKLQKSINDWFKTHGVTDINHKALRIQNPDKKGHPVS